ncbi:MAG: HEAT repeat protein [Planctomycetota bacterium]|jgi:HEAT repeat protein
MESKENEDLKAASKPIKYTFGKALIVILLIVLSPTYFGDPTTNAFSFVLHHFVLRRDADELLGERTEAELIELLGVPEIAFSQAAGWRLVVERNLDSLLFGLNHEKERIRKNAASWLGVFEGTARAAEALRQALGDPEARVRGYAAQSLGEQSDIALIQRLSQDESGLVRSYAADALGLLRTRFP